MDQEDSFLFFFFLLLLLLLVGGEGVEAGLLNVNREERRGEEGAPRIGMPRRYISWRRFATRCHEAGRHSAR